MSLRANTPNGWIGGAAGIALLLAIGAQPVAAAPVATHNGVLPYGTDLNDQVLELPTERFYFEVAGGKRSYLFNLGDMLFSSPAILGGIARKAGMSCNTCHQQGAGNVKLYVPGISSRPGTFDATNALFNPKTDNSVLDAVTPPSLRGARYLAPYGHDGRFGSLRNFVRNVIVNEFAGPEPSAQVLDALVAYVREISFLPNSKLAPGGKLTAQASDAARRGEVVFNKPFRHDATMSCGTCHVPSSAYVDHRVHDVGTGGFFKTPTLINADVNAPYFHDGRFDTYAEVVDYFDRHFDLGLTRQDRSDLVAYLDAVGYAEQPTTADTVEAELAEIAAFASVLDTAIPAHNEEVIALTADAVGNEWREVGENFPGRSDTSVSGGLAERLRARGAVRGVVLNLRRIAMAAAAKDFDGAAKAYADYRARVAAAEPKLKVAEQWSLFNPLVRQSHFAALKRLTALAK
jgi:cytochrome c peroxidase